MPSAEFGRGRATPLGIVAQPLSVDARVRAARPPVAVDDFVERVAGKVVVRM